MNVFYEEDGSFKVGAILTDNATSLQVEATHGKRSKIKANSVLLRFDQPGLGEFMDLAQRAAEDLEVDFLWECCGSEEFSFADLARDYYGRVPQPFEAAAVALRLHAAPMYFYRKGKGRYKAAPPEALKAALASEERKRRQAAHIAECVEQLTAFTLPATLAPHINTLLYKPDRSAPEYKALEQACAQTGMTAVRLLEKCGALPSSHEYHLNRFLLEHFPAGTGFPDFGDFVRDHPLPAGDAVAFSIDDASTTEIDDAFSVARLPDGNWRIGVHIAAPALGIVPGSTLDEIAFARQSTVYMPANKITMLPEAVVDHFTLREGAACPALSLYLDVARDDWRVLSAESRIERVTVAANLRHDTLEQVFNEEALAQGGGPDYPFRQELSILWALANRLEQARGKADSNQNPYRDYNFLVEGERVTITERKRGSPIDKVVSELMIYVNAHWGKQLADAGIAAVYRTQGNGKVRMTTAPAPHQGLGVECYAWASSPLRRYVDLINQRQLVALLRGEEAPYAPDSEALFAAIRDFELAYEAYQDIQRTMERYWCLRWLVQENIAVAAGSVLRENLVRLDGLPLVARLFGAPELPPGSVINVEVAHVDTWELEVKCKFRNVIAAEEATEPAQVG